MPRRRLLSLLLLLGLIAGSCGDEAEVLDRPADEQVGQLRQDLETALPEASELQQEVLDDGFVSPSEADRVAADVVVCAAGEGVVVESSWDDQNGGVVFRTKNNPSDPDDPSNGVFDRCWNERYRLVGEALALQNALSTEERVELERAMIGCLGEQGIDIERWPAEGVDPAIEGECYEESSSAAVDDG